MSKDSVWRDPMYYNPMRDGPPYLPVTESQRHEIREYINKSAAYYDVPKPKSPYDVLSKLLVGLRFTAMVHQTAHWQAKGNSFYGDHLLFQRLYEESQEGIDGVAERLIGLTGDVSKVSLCDQIRDMHTIAKVWHGHCGDDLAAVSLRGEMALIKLIAFFKKSLQDEGSLTEGLDDLLQGIASKHEEFVYLLKQRSSRPVYNYGR